MPPELEAYNGTELAGVFRRSFVLSEKPAAATLSWRLLKDGNVVVNHFVIAPPASSLHNWKTTAQADIASYLRTGTNEIFVETTNSLGPPAVSLRLDAGSFRLESDESWQVSVSGSTERAAQFASEVPTPQKGNELYATEKTSEAFGKSWPALLVIAAISVGSLSLWRRYKILLAVVAMAWLALFLHNFPSLPYAAGFDAQHHLEYITYLQEHHRLPHANEGWEMFQPPLYYIVSASLLSLIHSGVSHGSGILLLRFFGLFIGLINVALVFIGLRLVFPQDWKKPLAGAVLAAFLPAQICLLHYPTNETLSAMFVTGALCICLRMLTAAQPWRGWGVALGLALGLALSTKSSALLAVPVTLGTLVASLIVRREKKPLAWVEFIIVPLAVCLLTGGGHYYRLWRDFRNPFIGNWDPKVAAPWWQYKGIQTPGYFFAFGHALSRPFFSGLYSFWDGLYSTLWGDGLLGGKVNIWSRPPWNYDLMAVSFVLALAPTFVVLTGVVIAVRQFFRNATAPWILLLGFGWLFGLAIVHMSLKVPSYAQTKAFYGLPVLLPFCAVGALGFEYWTKRGRILHYAIASILAVWIMTVYASFWIRPETAQSELSSAIAVSLYLKGDDSQWLENILKEHPGDAETMVWLAASPEFKKNPAQAMDRLEQAFKEHPDDAGIEAYLAWYLAENNRPADAMSHAKHALELAPQDKIACQIWMKLALRNKDHEDALAATRQVLSLDPTDALARSTLKMLESTAPPH